MAKKEALAASVQDHGVQDARSDGRGRLGTKLANGSSRQAPRDLVHDILLKLCDSKQFFTEEELAEEGRTLKTTLKAMAEQEGISLISQQAPPAGVTVASPF